MIPVCVLGKYRSAYYFERILAVSRRIDMIFARKSFIAYYRPPSPWAIFFKENIVYSFQAFHFGSVLKLLYFFSFAKIYKILRLYLQPSYLRFHTHNQ